VNFTVRFRGVRSRTPRGHEQLDIILKQLEDIANIETRPMMEARAMSVIVAPKPADAEGPQKRAAQEKARQLAEKEAELPRRRRRRALAGRSG